MTPAVGGGVYVAPSTGLASQAKTPAAGTPLVNGTPTILTWQVPNDGKTHAFMVAAVLTVSANLTGGAVQVNYTEAGVPTGVSMFAAAETAAGSPYTFNNQGTPPNPGLLNCDPGTTITVVQATAATAGAGSVIAEIFGQ